MHSIDRILVTTDLSETSQTAFRIARQMAEKFNAEIVLLHAQIVQYAVDSAIDLIVMATHGRGFLSHALLGSTTERVVRRAHCPVLTVSDTPLED